MPILYQVLTLTTNYNLYIHVTDIPEKYILYNMCKIYLNA